MIDEIQTTPMAETIPATTPVGEVTTEKVETPDPVTEATPPSPEASPSAPALPTNANPAADLTDPARAKSFLQRALEVIRFRKRAKLEKIVQFATKHGSVTNDQVEKLLHVSDSTATRYLAELVRNGRLKRSGSASHTVYQVL